MPSRPGRVGTTAAAILACACVLLCVCIYIYAGDERRKISERGGEEQEKGGGAA